MIVTKSRAENLGSALTCIINGFFYMSIKPAIKAGLRATGFPAVLQNRSQAANGSDPSPDGGLSTSLLCPWLPDTAFSTDCHRINMVFHCDR